MRVETVNLESVGPFSWPGAPDAPSIFESEEGRQSGIYLWTVPRPEGHLICYVAETGRSFAQRMLQHHTEHAAGFYHVYSPVEYASGHKLPLFWPGRHDPSDRRSAIECIERYAGLAPYLADLTRIYRFLLAATSVEARVRRRVEAAIAGAPYGLAAGARAGDWFVLSIAEKPRDIVERRGGIY